MSGPREVFRERCRLVAVDQPSQPVATPSIQVSGVSSGLSSEVASSEPPERRFITAAAAWLAPIDPSSPCGLDPAGREGFIDAQDELAKLASPSGGAVDWARVEAGSDAVLLCTSKDLRAAAWFTLARAHRTGPSGLALGLTIVVGLFESFGETIFPRKPRSVRDQSEWLIKHSAAALRDTTADIDAPILVTLRALGERLAVVLRARLGEDAPSLRPLRDILAERSEQLASRTPVVPVATPERPAPPEPTAPASPPAVPMLLTGYRVMTTVNGWHKQYGNGKRIKCWLRGYHAATQDRVMGAIAAKPPTDAPPNDGAS